MPPFIPKMVGPKINPSERINKEENRQPSFVWREMAFNAAKGINNNITWWSLNPNANSKAEMLLKPTKTSNAILSSPEKVSQGRKNPTMMMIENTRGN